MPDRLAVEAELTAYYDSEAESRARRPLRGRRVEARDRFLAKIGLSAPVLEVGTGTGRDVSEFVKRDLAVVGVDLSLEQARHSQLAGAHQVLASARHLPFPDNTFSSLWSMSTLMHVPNRTIQETMTELHRVLAPGGMAGIGVWGGPDVEDYGDLQGPPGHRRLFSRRSDETWCGLLGLLGRLLVFETWDDDGDDFWYQWALVEVRP